MMSQVKWNNIIPPRYKLSWKKIWTLIQSSAHYSNYHHLLAPLLPRDLNNCSSIALPMFWHHVGDKTSPGPQISKVRRDISLGQKSAHGQKYSTLKSYKQSNNTKEKQHNPKWHWQLIHRYNMIIQKKKSTYVTTTWQHWNTLLK